MAHPRQIDIANRLNVTRITVSKALRNHTDISAGMKKKVLKVAAELGYVPNLIAQNLTSHKTFTIGVVIPDLENSFFSFATDSIIDTVSKRKYNAFVTISRENQKSEKLNILKLIGMRVDGLLICVSQKTNDPQVFNYIKKLNIPLVFFDRQFEGLGLPHITYDDKNGAINALEKIIQEGYTKIAHAAGYNNISIGKERCLGYKEALTKNKIKINPAWIIEGGFEVKDGYNAFMKLYKSGNLPEIYFAVNDRVALGIYHAAKEKKVRIPEDMGVIAFGFNETAQTFTPTLTVINQDPRKLGIVAAEKLLNEMTNKVSKKNNRIIIEEQFLWGESIIKKKNISLKKL